MKVVDSSGVVSGFTEDGACHVSWSPWDTSL